MFPVDCARARAHTRKKCAHSAKMSAHTKKKRKRPKFLKNFCSCVSNLELLMWSTAYSYLERKINKSESDSE